MPNTLTQDGADTSQAYVFISYAHADADFVYPEARRLIAQGYRVWYDERILAGAAWRDEIAHAIEHAAAVLLFVSTRSITSAHCQKEIHHALEHARPLLAVHLERTRMAGGIGFAIGNEQGLRRYELAADAYTAQLGQWLSGHLGAASSGERIGGERILRRVAIVVCDLVFGTEPPVDVHELKLAFAEFCARQLMDFDGRVIDTFDGRTVTLFGFPDSFEDNAARAALAASRLQESFAGFRSRVAALSEMPFDLAIVLHSDTVIADRERDTTITGHGLRTAVRAALNVRDGGVYVTASSAERFCRDGRFTHSGASVPSLRLLEATPEIAQRNHAVTAIADPLFVGRQTELALLTGMLRQTEQGQGGCVFISGQAGIGKSRLARTFRERLGDSAVWLQIAGLPDGDTEPLQPFRATFERAWYIRPDDPPEQRMAKAIAAVQRVGLEAEDARTALADLLGLEPAPGRLPQGGEQRRDALLTLVLDWFAALTAGTTVVLSVDDLHWLDPTSVELTLELAREALERRLLVLVTGREPPDDEFAALPNLARLDLRPLTDAEAHGLLSQHLPAPARSAELIDALIERADGLPLFLDELARMATSSGALERVPDSLEDLLNSRMDQLQLGQHVAPWAAALGREFGYDLLARVVPVSAEQLDAALAEMMAEQVLYRRGIGRRRTFQFRHALLRDAAYQAIPPQDRSAIHATIAAALLQADSDGREARAVAGHLRAAGDHAAASAQFHRAATRALQQCAYREARQDLNNALQELQHSGDAAPQQLFALQVDRFVAASAIAGYSSGEALGVLEEARVLAHRMGDPAAVASFMQKVCFLYAQRGEVLTAQTFARQIEQLPDSATQRVRQRFVEAMGATSLLAGVPASASRYLHEAVEHARVWSDPHDLIDSGVFSHSFLAVVHLLGGRFASARDSCAAAQQIAARIDQPFSTACAWDAVTKLHLLSRDTARTREAALELIVTSDDFNLEFFAAMGHVLRGWARALEGEVSAGRDEMLDAMAVLEAQRSGRERTLYLGLLAEVYLLDGNRRAADEMLATARQLAERSGERFNLPQLLRLQAELATDQRRFDSLNRDAVGLARAQQSALFELRALVSRLRRMPGDRASVTRLRELLAQLDETPDAEDFVEARRVLAGG